MKKTLIILAGIMLLMGTIIPKEESPYYFFAHDNDTLRSRITYITSGKTLSNYQLEYFDTWDSCLFKIDELDLMIIMENFVMDSTSMIDSVIKYRLIDLLNQVIIDGEKLDSVKINQLLNTTETEEI